MDRMLIIKNGVEIGYLTPREAEIAKLLAWGYEKKEVAELLFISVSTVTNTAANVYEKLKVRNIGELSSWWYCNLCPTLEEHRPLVSLLRKSKTIAFILLVLIGVSEMYAPSDMIRVRASKITRTTRVAKARKIREDYIIS